jgi:hypothetical protein
MPEAWDDTMRRLIEAKLVPSPLYRILLYGPPRTGKSSAGPALFPNKWERCTVHKQLPTEDLLGGYALVDGTTKWMDGPAIRALRNGKTLILDEIDQISPECRCILHALLDDPAGITLASGERVDAKEGYCVIATTNALPSSLAAPILDRFDLILLANTLSKGLQAALGKLSMQADAVVQRDKTYNWVRPASVNLFIAASKLRKRGLKDQEVVESLGLYGKSATDALIALRG